MLPTLILVRGWTRDVDVGENEMGPFNGSNIKFYYLGWTKIKGCDLFVKTPLRNFIHMKKKHDLIFLERLCGLYKVSQN